MAAVAKVISLYDEAGNPRNPLEILKEVQKEFEPPTKEGYTVVLDESKIPTELPTGPEAEEFGKSLVWGIGNADTNGNTEIYPMNSDRITIHGAEEMWFFICRLLDCSPKD